MNSFYLFTFFFGVLCQCTFFVSGIKVITNKPTSPSAKPSSILINYVWNQSLVVLDSTFVAASSASGQLLVAASVRMPTEGLPIYISKDTGKSWISAKTLTSTSTGWQSIKVSSDGQYIIASSVGSSLFVSSDQGETWYSEQKSIFNQFTSFSISLSSNGQFIFASTIRIDEDNGKSQTGVYVSSDYSMTFSNKNTFGISADFSAITSSASGENGYALFCADNKVFLFISSDYGNGWDSYSLNNLYKLVPAVLDRSLILSFSITTSGNGQYVATAIFSRNLFTDNIIGTVYVSSDYGKTWKLFLSTSTSPVMTTSSEISMSASGQQVVVAVGSGVYISNDFGVTWVLSKGSPKANSVSITGNGGLVVVGTVSGGSVTIGKNLKLYKSPSYKSTSLPTRATFTLQPSSYKPTSTNTPITKLTTKEPSTKPATAAPSTVIQYNWNAIMEVRGDSNMYVSSSSNGQYILAISVSPVSYSHFAAGQSIYLSNNSGVSWGVIQTLTSPQSGWATVTVSSSGQYMATTSGSKYNGPYSKIFISNSYGLTWTESSNGLPYFNTNNYLEIWTVKFSYTANYMYAIINSEFDSNSNDNRIYMSTDFGNTWSGLSGYGSNMFVAVSGSGKYIFELARVFYPNEYDYFYFSVSSDYGITFTQLYRVNYYERDYFLIFSTNKPTAIATSFSGQYVMIMNKGNPCSRSEDFGKTFTLIPISLDSTVNNAGSSVSLSMSSSGQYAVVSAYPGGVYISNNYGVSWFLSSSTTNAYSVSMSLNGFSIIAGTTLGFIYSGKSLLTSSPSFKITARPTTKPTRNSTNIPIKTTSRNPTTTPTRNPTNKPTNTQSRNPSRIPTNIPIQASTRTPTIIPTKNPKTVSTRNPTITPTRNPTMTPTRNPTMIPTRNPTIKPTRNPTKIPTRNPTKIPTRNPTKIPTKMPTKNPTARPTRVPTNLPSVKPTEAPVESPSVPPSETPTETPTETPSLPPTENPETPSLLPTENPTETPSENPETPSLPPTETPSLPPSETPTYIPSM